MLTPMLAEMSGNLHVGLAALGAAIGVGFIGMKGAEAVGRNPGASTKVLVQSLITIAFAEAIVFYAIFLEKFGRQPGAGSFAAPPSWNSADMNALEFFASIGDDLGKLGVDWPHLIAQIISFLLVAGLLYKFAYKPI